MNQVMSNDLPEGLPLHSCVLKEQINGEVSLTFSIPSDHIDSKNVQIGDHIVLKDLDAIFRAFFIVDEQETHSDTFTRQFYAEDLGVNELNDEIVTDIRPQNTNAETALSRILKHTIWKVGQVDNLGINSMNVYYESVMSGVKKMLQTWGGELRFRVTMNSQNQITGRYVDLLSQLGRRTGKRFEYGKDLTNVERVVDIKMIKTALFGRGKGVEDENGTGFGRRLNFADVEWSQERGDPCDKPLHQEWIGDPESLGIWGHVSPDGSKRHRFDVFTSEEETDAEKLLQKTWERLHEIKQPMITYKMDVIDLEQVSAQEYKHEAIRLGDSVFVIDRKFSVDVQLEARIIELERDLISPENTKVTLGNVLGDIGSYVKELQDELKKKVSIGDPIGWLEGARDIENIEFERSGAYVYMNDVDGLLTTNRPKGNIDHPPDAAVQIKSAGVRIANSLKPDGSFDWKTFMTAGGMIADNITSGKIRTNDVEIGDDDGKVLISRGSVIIKGGELEVYSTPNATDTGVMIKGNKISTNFVKNPEFLFQPNGEVDWYLHSGVKYDTSKKVTVDCSENMNFVGVSQYLDISHEKATFQALFKTNQIGGSTPKRARIVLYNFDENGNQLESRTQVEEFSIYQENLLLTMSVVFPKGTVRCKLWVQVELKKNVEKGMELLWVKGNYDDIVTQQQMSMYPRDVYNVDSVPEIQIFRASVDHSGLAANVYRNCGRIQFDKPFSPPEETGSVSVLLTPSESKSVDYHASAYNIDRTGFNLFIRTFTAIPAGTLEVSGLAYRAGYMANIGLSI
ncbi:phage minor structural protein, N-terminal region [Thermoactinomyces sp. DSM 45892]|nr:phage minor structural protein, N-terminal region [Thermoactinomyces sp. DSM 45892]